MDSSTNKRIQQKQQTALLILDAAKKLFAEQGFENTTTRSIATEAGVGIGTVFAHYPDKISLLGQALRGEIGQVVEESLKGLGQQRGLTEQLVHLSVGLMAYYIKNQSLSRELIKYATFQEGPEAEAFNEQMGSFIQVVSSIIEQAVEEGVLDNEVQVPAMAKNYMAIHFFIVGQCLRLGTPQLDDQITQMREMVQALFAGYCRPGAGLDQ